MDVIPALSGNLLLVVQRPKKPEGASKVLKKQKMSFPPQKDVIPALSGNLLLVVLRGKARRTQ